MTLCKNISQKPLFLSPLPEFGEGLGGGVISS